MSGLRGAGASLAAGLILAGCTTTDTFVDYSDHQLYSTQSVGNAPYLEIGPVTAQQRGFVWESCSDMADEAAKELLAQGEEFGATHVMDVRWLDHADGSFSERPVCTTGWGWFAAAGVGGLSPWAKVTEIHGSLATVDPDALEGAEARASTRIEEIEERRREELRRRHERQQAEEAESESSDDDE
ncbi:hypothetical protein ACNSTU_17160 [Aquisalimonas sp. APHAB1-3]|uniref:hypothetical protein n=1 Tax=Aquisalimonas sp. APHAB1-3 TaxID=3402080 RepID=UPI003AAC943F